MPQFEYKVVPAPQKGQKAQGVKGSEAKFAHAIETLMNEMASQGWEYQRAEMLPSSERSGLTGSSTEWRNLLVFRRLVAAKQAQPRRPAPAPEPQQVAMQTREVRLED